MNNNDLALEFSLSTDTYELSDRQLVEQFFKSRKSKATSQNYFKGLSYVLGFSRDDRDAATSKIADFVTFAKQNRAMVEFKLIDWILKKKDGVAGATLRSYVSATKSLLEYCGVTINWKQVQSVLPAARRTADRDATPMEATRKLYAIADLRIKFLVSLFASSGIRIGALDYLRVKDLREFKSGDVTIGLLSIYTGEPEHYETFCSSECLDLWKEYRAERERLGEKVTGDSPLLRNQSIHFFHRKSGRVEERKYEMVRAISSNSVRDLFSQLWHKAAYPTRPWKEVHGWRSAFKTTLTSAGMQSIRVELLMGHVQGLQQSYDHPTTEALAKDYVAHEHLLTISEALELASKLKKAEAEKNNADAQLRSTNQTLLKRLEEKDAQDQVRFAKYDLLMKEMKAAQEKLS